MAFVLAPYNDSMRLGQGYNSYKQQSCIDNAVTIEATKAVDPRSVSQVVSYSAKVVNSLSEVVDGMNLSYYSSIKKGTIEVTGSTNTVNESTFKTSDLNAVVSVKVTNQGQEVMVERSKFQELKDMSNIIAGGPAFNEIYGDSYISGFLTGGEFTGIISIKVIDRRDVSKTVSKIKSALSMQKENEEVMFSAVDAQMQSNLASAMQNTETTISVAWMGGGQVKPAETAWDLQSVLAAAAAFPARVAECPQRTWAILTKYQANRSFVEHAKKSSFELLEYDQIHTYTADLFDSYMDYKMLLAKLNVMIDNIDDYEARKGDDAIQADLSSLLALKAVFRQEQAKIVRAVEVLSKDPGVLRRAATFNQIEKPSGVKKILEKVLGRTNAEIEKASEAMLVTSDVTTSKAATTSIESQSSSTLSAGLERSKNTFDFSLLVPAEVWDRTMPVKKSLQPSLTGVVSGDGQLTPESLDGFVFAEDATSSKGQETGAVALCPDFSSLDPNSTVSAWIRRYSDLAPEYRVTRSFGPDVVAGKVQHHLDNPWYGPEQRLWFLAVSFDESGHVNGIAQESTEYCRAAFYPYSDTSTSISADEGYQSVWVSEPSPSNEPGYYDNVHSVAMEAAETTYNGLYGLIRISIATESGKKLEWLSPYYDQLKQNNTISREEVVPDGYRFHSFWIVSTREKKTGAAGVVWVAEGSVSADIHESEERIETANEHLHDRSQIIEKQKTIDPDATAKKVSPDFLRLDSGVQRVIRQYAAGLLQANFRVVGTSVGSTNRDGTTLHSFNFSPWSITGPASIAVAFHAMGPVTALTAKHGEGRKEFSQRCVGQYPSEWAELHQDIDKLSVWFPLEKLSGGVCERVQTVSMEYGTPANFRESSLQDRKDRAGLIRVSIKTSSGREQNWKSPQYDDWRDADLPLFTTEAPVGYELHSFWCQPSRVYYWAGPAGVVWSKIINYTRTLAERE